jgi:hemerythrin-like metal-binding protein
MPRYCCCPVAQVILNAPSIVEEIDKEHTFLIAELGRLDGMLSELTCAGDCKRVQPCPEHLEASCQRILDDFAASLLDFMQRHFAYEEQHMKRPDHPQMRDVFERHKEAHADLTEAISSALYSGSTRIQRESIVSTISHWMTEHIDTHDRVLVNWLMQPA